jgi:hypothetical protein
VRKAVFQPDKPPMLNDVALIAEGELAAEYPNYE